MSAGISCGRWVLHPRIPGSFEKAPCTVVNHLQWAGLSCPFCEKLSPASIVCGAGAQPQRPQLEGNWGYQGQAVFCRPRESGQQS